MEKCELLFLNGVSPLIQLCRPQGSWVGSPGADPETGIWDYKAGR